VVSFLSLISMSNLWKRCYASAWFFKRSHYFKWIHGCSYVHMCKCFLIRYLLSYRLFVGRSMLKLRCMFNFCMSISYYKKWIMKFWSLVVPFPVVDLCHIQMGTKWGLYYYLFAISSKSLASIDLCKHLCLLRIVCLY
jgi:hypothetical protein